MTIDELKQRLPLPDLLARYRFTLRKNNTMCCPFHQDKSPSFGIYTGPKGDWKWKCFAGCGQGDVLDFIAKYEVCSSSDAKRRAETYIR